MERSKRKTITLYDAGLGGLAVVSGCVGVVAAVVVIVLLAKVVTKSLQNNYDAEHQEKQREKEQMEMDMWVKDQIAKMEREKKEQQK